MGLSFFVVDDTDAVRMTLVRLLSHLGHRVVGQADNIEGAIAGCIAADFDLLACDLGIPRKRGEKPIRLGGFEVASAVNKMKPGVGIIFISATDDQTMAEIMEKSKAASMTAVFIQKPFTMGMLEGAINSVIRKLFC